LNRSHSRRNVFDVSDSVPLLPEVIENNAQTHANVAGRHLPDMADKETQTSVSLIACRLFLIFVILYLK
jgi:hypothetical protein